MYVSRLGISGALYLAVFEQPENRVFFSTLLGCFGTGIMRREIEAHDQHYQRRPDKEVRDGSSA